MEKTTDLKLLGEGKIWVYKNKVLITDQPGCQRRDAVLPLCHENRFLVEHMCVPAGGTVLDLCTGSGVLSIFAADHARNVIGVDINPRAINFAELNAQLNGTERKTEWRLGNLFEPVRGIRFDAILANPPFEPTPDGCSNYLHSDGGVDGLDVIRKIIERLPEHLESHGSFQMVAWLSAKSVSLLDQLGKWFGTERVVVKSLFEFSMSDYIRHQTQASRLPSSRSFPRPSKSVDWLRYVYIHVLPTKSLFYRKEEVYNLDKAIPVAGAVV